MTQKYPMGTAVRVKAKYPLREDLRLKVFLVTEMENSGLVHGITGEGLFEGLIYETPFISLSGDGNSWVPEEWLEPFDPDIGFEYLDDYSVWTPAEQKVPLYGHVNA